MTGSPEKNQVSSALSELNQTIEDEKERLNAEVADGTEWLRRQKSRFTAVNQGDQSYQKTQFKKATQPTQDPYLRIERKNLMCQ